MDENYTDIVEEYFRHRKYCNSLDCAKVIFEPEQKREWFFDEGKWCYFEFLCDDNDYRLVKTEEKDFDDSCILKDMSYEIKMLLAYIRLRGVSVIEKEMFSTYVNNFEKAREFDPELTIEKFNYDLKDREELALVQSDKVANGIMAGCLALAAAVVFLFLVAIVSYVKLHYFS